MKAEKITQPHHHTHQPQIGQLHDFFMWPILTILNVALVGCVWECLLPVETLL